VAICGREWTSIKFVAYHGVCLVVASAGGTARMIGRFG
jgi:hypothetical protein